MRRSDLRHRVEIKNFVTRTMQEESDNLEKGLIEEMEQDREKGDDEDKKRCEATDDTTMSVGQR